jgi:hypothetical protein
LFDVKSSQQPENIKLEPATIMILAGLVSVADWIGSDAEFFKCEISDFNE